MKRTILICILAAFFTTAKAQNRIKPDIKIIPEPIKTEQFDRNLEITNNISFTYTGFKQAPKTLISFTQTILALPQKEKNKRLTKVTFRIDTNTNSSSEGYKLSINQQGILISAREERGVFYGLQTLAQVIHQRNGEKSVPYLNIEDHPRFDHRGGLLDVGRHIFPVSFVKTYIDLLARYKFNKFHWHLTEDQGWRIEIKKYPKLTAVGGYRNQTLINHLKDKTLLYDSTSYGGFYTQNEIKEIVAYASSKYIDVIPEIELPGHSLAALNAYPEYGCGTNPGPYKTAEKWGVFDDVYCGGKEQTFKFLEDILDEVVVLFPSKYIHIGGDECPKTKWKTCSFCQDRIKKENLKDEHELQSYFIKRIENYLNHKGRQIIGWDEILEGGLAPNATVMSWRGIKGGIAAAKQKHNVIMTPSSHLYLDHKESNSQEEPLTIGFGVNRIIPLEKVYSFDPIPAELTEDEKKYVIGIQGNLWTEYISTPEKALYHLLPRMLAVAEIGWTPLENKNWQKFSEIKLAAHLADIDKSGFMYRVPEPIGSEEKTIFGNHFTFEFKAPVEGSKIYYTTNGRIPYQTDNLYSKPFKVIVPKGEERILKTVTVTPSGKRSVVVTTKLVNKEANSSK